MTLPERIGARIKALRKAAGLTQEQLAEKADCTISMVSMTERGLRTPSLEMLERVATAMRCQFLPKDGLFIKRDPLEAFFSGFEV